MERFQRFPKNICMRKNNTISLPIYFPPPFTSTDRQQPDFQTTNCNSLQIHSAPTSSSEQVLIDFSFSSNINTASSSQVLEVVNSNQKIGTNMSSPSPNNNNVSVKSAAEKKLQTLLSSVSHSYHSINCPPSDQHSRITYSTLTFDPVIVNN